MNSVFQKTIYIFLLSVISVIVSSARAGELINHVEAFDYLFPTNQNQVKGDLAEFLVNRYMAEHGYTRIGRINGQHGVDGNHYRINPETGKTEIKNIETKYRDTPLSVDTDGLKQGTREYIENRNSSDANYIKKTLFDKDFLEKVEYTTEKPLETAEQVTLNTKDDKTILFFQDEKTGKWKYNAEKKLNVGEFRQAINHTNENLKRHNTKEVVYESWLARVYPEKETGRYRLIIWKLNSKADPIGNPIVNEFLPVEWYEKASTFAFLKNKRPELVERFNEQLKTPKSRLFNYKKLARASLANFASCTFIFIQEIRNEKVANNGSIDWYRACGLAIVIFFAFAFGTLLSFILSSTFNVANNKDLNDYINIKELLISIISTSVTASGIYTYIYVMYDYKTRFDIAQDIVNWVIFDLLFIIASNIILELWTRKKAKEEGVALTGTPLRKLFGCCRVKAERLWRKGFKPSLSFRICSMVLTVLIVSLTMFVISVSIYSTIYGFHSVKNLLFN